MQSKWVIVVKADSNHVSVETVGSERVGSTWLYLQDVPSLDMICDVSEDRRQLLKDALVHLIERL